MTRIAWLLAITASVGLGAATGSEVEAQAHRKRPPARSHASKPAAPTPKAGASASDPVEPAPVEPAELDAPSGTSAPSGAEPPKPESTDDSQPAASKAAKPAVIAKAEAKPDSAALQQELAQLMDDLVQARERVAVIGKALFKTRVRIKIDNRAQADQVAGRVTLRLDGAPIYSADGGSLGDAERPLYDGFAAPGPHVLELELEQRARSDEGYRYAQRQSFRFEVLRDLRTDLRLVLEDDSDIADDFHDDREGEYDVRTRFQVRAVPLSEE